MTHATKRKSVGLVGSSLHALESLWNAMPRIRGALYKLMPQGSFAHSAITPVVRHLNDARRYRRWLAVNEVRPSDDARFRAASAGLAYRPLVSIVTPVFDIDDRWLRRCIDSVMHQAYERWELCLVDDASTQPHVQRTLAEYARREPRIRVARRTTNAGIVAASAEALAMASGEFVTFLDHDDELSRDALLEIVRALQEEGVDLVYSDEDKLDKRGRRVDPFFKPDWSPDLLLSMNYVCHLAAIRRKTVEEAGGLRPGFDGSQDHDLFLRVAERARRITHVPKVLYHWRKVPGSAAAERTAKPYAIEAGRRAIEAALHRRSIDGGVEMPYPGMYRVRYTVRRQPRVSIIIPTRDRAELLRACISTIEAQTRFPNYEVIVVDNASQDPAALAYLAELKRRHRVLDYPRAFNWSAINNFAVRETDAELLLFLNNDIEILQEAWLDALVEHGQRGDVGAVGAKLLYPDGRIQHAGVVLGVGAVAGHAFKYHPADTLAHFGFAQVVRNVSAVTGACMMVKRTAFEQVGGFDEELRVAYNDIDFCLKLRREGYSVIYTPFAVLRHHESATRRAESPPEDEARMQARWKTTLGRDPFYNPNLTRKFEDYRVGE